MPPAFAIITAQERMTKTRILPLFGPNFKSVQSFLKVKPLQRWMEIAGDGELCQKKKQTPKSKRLLSNYSIMAM